MKKIYYILFGLLTANVAFAATYRNYVAHSISGNTYRIWVNSNTVPGEDVIGQICYTPLGGGSTLYTGFQTGSYFVNSQLGANWRVDITIPNGASNLMLELANENEANDPYGWTGCNVALSNVLPVKLVSFAATTTKEGISLNWATAQEQNNAYFILERANDGLNFSPIAQIKGHGTTDESFSYSFIDAKPLNGSNYYRLKDVDTKGKSTYSKVIASNFSANKAVLSFSPNPIINDIKIHYTAVGKGVLPIQVFNAAGKIIFTQTLFIEEGENELNLNLSLLSQGVYYLRLYDKVASFIKL